MPQDLTLLQGRTARYLLGPLLDAQGAAYDLTNKDLRLMVKADMATADASAEINYTASIDGAGAVTSTAFTAGGTDTTETPPVVYTLAEGVLTITFADEDTETMTPGTFLWELVVIDGADTYQLLAGTVTVTDTLIDSPEVP
jgi:hypothetical protein